MEKKVKRGMKNKATVFLYCLTLSSRKVAVTEGTQTFSDASGICSVTSASLETLKIHPLQHRAANISTLIFAAMVLDQ